MIEEKFYCECGKPYSTKDSITKHRRACQVCVCVCVCVAPDEMILIKTNNTKAHGADGCHFSRWHHNSQPGFWASC